jgi:endonuclease/exonuclease/phosphatase family metal-dependent hydrolase
VNSLRVATLNLASGRGRDGRSLSAGQLPGALADLAAAVPDVLSAQEVDVCQPRSGSVHQAALLADVLRRGGPGGSTVDWRFAPALAGTPGLQRDWEPVPGALLGPDDELPSGPLYGIALISRVPVRSWHVLTMSAGRARLPLRVNDPRSGRRAWRTFPDEPRVGLAAVLDDGPGDGTVVVATHLSFAPLVAGFQLRRLLAWQAGLPGSPGGGVRLVAGDLNLPGRLPELVSGGRSLVRGATYPAWDPRLQLDHVLSVGTPVRAQGRVLALPHGDHRAVVADLALR